MFKSCFQKIRLQTRAKLAASTAQKDQDEYAKKTRELGAINFSFFLPRTRQSLRHAFSMDGIQPPPKKYQPPCFRLTKQLKTDAFLNIAHLTGKRFRRLLP